MPLKVEHWRGALYITGTVRPSGEKEGRRVRQRAGSDNRRLAEEEAIRVEAQILRDFHHGERPSSRNFAEAVKSYLAHEDRSVGTIQYAARLLTHFGETPLGAIDQEAWDKARPLILRPGAGPGAGNRALAVLQAILHHAERRKWVQAPTFDKPREPKGRTEFFMPDQAEGLIAAGQHLSPLIRFLFCTGCRLGEALALEWDAVDLQGRRIILWEGETKSGARRVVDLVPAAVATLGALPGRSGPVFLTHKGQPYREGGGYGGQIKTAWASSMARAGLSGLTPHHARHTWASWHYALHRDLIALQQAGGWSDIGLVTRYAHVVPVGMEDAIRRVWGIGVVQVVKRRA